MEIVNGNINYTIEDSVMYMPYAERVSVYADDKASGLGFSGWVALDLLYHILEIEKNKGLRVFRKVYQVPEGADGVFSLVAVTNGLRRDGYKFDYIFDELNPVEFTIEVRWPDPDGTFYTGDYSDNYERRIVKSE